MQINNIIPFSFEGKEVRVAPQGNEPWWMLTDVCKVLDITNTGNASARLDRDEKSTIHITDSGNLNAERTIINESGLWSLVLTSRKPEAKRFKKWLTSEVIPSIRKTGGYIATNENDTPEIIMARALRVADQTIKEKIAQLEIAQPKAEAFDELANTEGLFTLRDSAKLCGWPERIFIKRLTMPPIKWLYAQSSSGRKLAYAAAIQAGHIEVKEVTIFHKTTGREMYGQPMITQKGLAKLRLILGSFPGNTNMLASTTGDVA